MKTIAVFFGGRSSEHEISVITGMYAVNLLRSAEYRVLPVYLPVEGGMYCSERLRGVEDFRDGMPGELKKVFLTESALRLCSRPKKEFAKLDCALNCCHGGGGEGGVLSALLEWHGVRSASPQLAPSAVFLDKSLSKYVLKGLGIPVVDSLTVWKSSPVGESVERIGGALGYPVVVKPARLGSSVGISVAENAEELSKALAFAFCLDGCVLAEKYLSGKRDLNCAAYRRGGEIVLSAVEEVFSGNPILTFGEKYEGACERSSEIPAQITAQQEAEIRSELLRVYEAFALCGVVRADFLLCDGKVYFNELNTVPGTLATYLFGGSLTSARALLVALIEDALARPQERGKIVSSGILRAPVFGAKSSKRR